MSTMEDWVKAYGADIHKTFPHHLLIVWYPAGQWAINADNLRVDHMMCLMEWIEEQLVGKELSMMQRYHLYRMWGRSRWHAVRLALVRP